MDKWTEYLEQGGQIDVTYSDFEKAFDKVSHNRLIYKIKLYGFSNDIITWIQDFLNGISIVEFNVPLDSRFPKRQKI